MTLIQNRTDQTFHISHEHLDLALNQVALGFWEVDLQDGGSMACTDQCKRNFGRDPSASFSYQDVLNSVIPEDQEEMQAAVAKAIDENAPYFAQYRVKHPNGTIHWIEAKGMVLRNDNMPTKIIGTTVDITKLKDLETLRDELLSIAMHELKTPLSTVKGSLQLVEQYLQKHNEEKLLGITTRAVDSTDRITRLLNDIAQPVMAESSEIILQKNAFDLLALIKEITENAALLDKKHQITISANEDKIMISADRFRIAQVVTNLLNNAVKYSPGEPLININIFNAPSETIVKVTDQGVGIPPEDRAKVFQKFYRSGQHRSIEGLGIGLYLCSEIILRHSGTIGIDDTAGTGTTVYFTLPG